ncbi:MAG: Mu-like prophage major head subunit gpT family protein [Myxococcota bacterium]
MALSVTQIVELIENDGYPAMFETYDRVPPVYQNFGEVINPADAGMPLYGDRGTVFMGVEDFRKREDGAEFDDSTMDKAFNWQCNIDQWARAITIPSRVREANDLQRARASIVRAANGWGEKAILHKEDHIAGMFQKGTLTAGSTRYFDNSFPDNADPNPGVIYDGQPWFDEAHPLAGSSSTFSNHLPTTTLGIDGVQDGLTKMESDNAVDERGDRIMIMPTHLVVPMGLRFQAQRIINSELIPGSQNNDINPIRGRLEVLPWRALRDATSAAAWWIIQERRGMRIYDSGAPRIVAKEKENGDIVVQAEFYFGACIDNARYALCGNKAAS